MKRTIFCLLSVFLLLSCKTKREIIQLEPEIRTVYVERNKVSDDDLMLLAMLKQGYRNFSTSPIYSTDTWEGRLQSRLLELCNSQMFQSSQLGLVVYDITDGKYIFTVNGDHRMRPASCQKLVTAISALDLLGGEYNYVPRIDEAGEGWCWDDNITSQMPYRERKTWHMNEVLHIMMKDSDNQSQYRELLSQADLVKYICPKFSYSSYQNRNEWMVDHSARVIAVFNGEKSGTKNTVDYAEQCGIEVNNIYKKSILSLFK